MLQCLLPLGLKIVAVGTRLVQVLLNPSLCPDQRRLSKTEDRAVEVDLCKWGCKCYTPRTGRGKPMMRRVRPRTGV